MKVYDDIGECLVAGYLEYIETCKSVSTNIKLHSAGRELDVLAIKDTKTPYSNFRGKTNP